jgi:UDP-N-acetyl-L-fucosamine synthase
VEKVNKLKIVTVVGTRPEIIRLSRIIDRLNKSKAYEHVLIHTGQNYDYNLNEVFFNDLELSKPNFYLDAAGKNSSETIGNIFIKMDKLLDKINPDAFLVLGDTNSCLSSIVAKKKKIPIFHFEAGNRCFDQRVPEETNRKIVDHIADINLTYSSISKNYLLLEGIDPYRVIKIGSPMLEVLSFYANKIDSSDILHRLKISKNKYFLVSCHREENVDDDKNLKKLVESLNNLSEDYNYPIIFPIHPRTKKKFDKSKLKFNKNIKLIEPLGFIDYNYLQKNSFIVLSDSGTIFEESSILNFRALNLRESHERPEAIEESSVIVSGLNYDRILQGIKVLESQKVGVERNISLVKDYDILNVSIKVERIILSYIDYINRMIWQKES